ncbi:hypothetical protein HNP29_000281 [Pseudomonas alcaligenes]|nr:hypothetical protein [Pseudomonas alcaligenes]
MSTEAENPFQTPTAELLAPTTGTEHLCLYSIPGIGIATFFGTPLAGAYVIAANLKAMGRGGETGKLWAVSIGFFIAIIVAGALLPENVPAIVFGVVQVIAMNAYARQLFGTQVNQHKIANGAFFSLWRSVGIGLLFMLGFIVAMVPVLLLFGLV